MQLKSPDTPSPGCKVDLLPNQLVTTQIAATNQRARASTDCVHRLRLVEHSLEHFARRQLITEHMREDMVVERAGQIGR